MYICDQIIYVADPAKVEGLTKPHKACPNDPIKAWHPKWQGAMVLTTQTLLRSQNPWIQPIDITLKSHN